MQLEREGRPTGGLAQLELDVVGPPYGDASWKGNRLGWPQSMKEACLFGVSAEEFSLKNVACWEIASNLGTASVRWPMRFCLFVRDRWIH